VTATATPTPGPQPLLEVEKVSRFFTTSGGFFSRSKGVVRAVDNVSLRVYQGETVGVVGESGCGKSTLGRVVLKLLEPSSGRIAFDGRELTRLTPSEMRPLRRQMQIVFQDPYSSLNPRMTVRDIVGEGLLIHNMVRSKQELDERVVSLLERVGLRPELRERYPHEFSGGQRQRIGIARALAVEPRFLVCDEPTSALDVSIQAQIINLLQELQETLGLSFLLISHDLKIVEYLSRRVAVMYLGRIVETGPVSSVFGQRYHPYTRALLSAIPIPDPTKRSLRVLVDGDPPSPLDPPKGCAFHPRCPKAQPGKCDVETPRLKEQDPRSSHQVACFFPGD
jgi:oligopeptide transport system ATP-binding protein